MTAQAGKNFLVKWPVSGTLTAIAGLRTRKLKFDSGEIDITHSESSGLWRELLDGGGVKSMEISGDGIFKDDTAIGAFMTDALAGTHRAAEIVVPGLGAFAGAFQGAVEIDGQHDGAVTYSVTMKSAGAVTFTAA